ncbi:MAG: ATP-dependent helicase [bacterium]|nr:ATP-dependent helicase [bacterium]
MELAVERKVTPNAKQMDCINNFHGKYLVLAGPGTGKTFTVIERIKNMISKGVEPEKILCLTFSNTAAREMKTKIGENFNVNVFTYHEFCLSIMEEFPDQFNILNLKIITDSHKRTLIKECIDKIKPVAYNNEKNNPYQYSKDILEGIEEIKKNRIKSESEFNKNLAENPLWEKRLAFLGTEKQTVKVKDELKSLSKKVAQMHELWEFYELYRQKMADYNYIDFSDMINMVLEKMEDKESSLLEDIAYKYDYIIVDEYQDTNKPQNDIVFNLSKYCKDILVVGDDDQIIYTFQGASLDTIENYLNNFPDARVICLTENNRSTQTILDVSQELAKLQNDFCKFMASRPNKSKSEIQKWESNKINLRICSMPKFEEVHKITKDLISPKTSPVFGKEKPVEFYSFPNKQEERDYIVGTIKNLVNSEDCPEKLSEIAILTRTNAELRDYEIYLKANGIPIEITGGKNIFDISSVNVLLTYMQFLTNPEMYSDKLLGYLFLQPFHIDARDYKTICDFKSHHKTLTDNINNLLTKGWNEKELKEKLQNILKYNSNTIMTDIENIMGSKKFTIYGEEKLKNFIKTYNYLRNYITNENFANSILEIGEKTGIFQYYFNNELNRLENIKGIKKLLDEADAYFSVHTTKENSFAHFVDYLTKMQEGGIEINLDKEDIPLNAVQLSTYHSSKGREFEYVFMPTLVSSKWESSSSSYKVKIPLPAKDATYEELVEKQDQAKFLDNIKLLYVGMTRAKHSLFLSATENDTKDGKISWFIKQIQEKLQDKENLLAYPEKTEIFGLAEIKSDYDYKAEFEDFIKSRLQKSYSASSLNTYRKCPREYFYNYILDLKASSGNTDNLNYGLAVHKAFQFVLNYAMDNKKYPTADEAYAVFAKAIDDLPCSAPDMMKKSAKDNIFSANKYYDKFIGIHSIENLNTRAEYSLNYTTEDGITFNGSIDRVDENPDGTYTIYDYKTGTDNSGITKAGSHSNYYYQICLYKYLFKKQHNISTDVSTCFIYPLLEENYHTRKDFSDDECENIAHEYIELVHRIHNLDFDRPEKCPNEKFCSYKSICKMNVL